MLLPSGADRELALELLREVPIGSLLLDLSTPHATTADRANLRYFENWSRLITSRAYAVATETMSLRSYGRRWRGTSCHRANIYKQLARATFLEALTKNPMRTFYFDTGLLGAARLAATQGLPKIQYVTTRRTRIGKSRSDPGKKMLEAVFESYGEGVDFYITDGLEWPEPGMSTWTLTPMGERLPGSTSCLWSIRSPDSRKIAHGLEGLRRNAYLRGVFDPSEVATEAAEAGLGALAGAAGGAALAPGSSIVGILLGSLVGSTVNLGRVRNNVRKVLDEISQVPSKDDYKRVREPSAFPTS